MLKTAILVLGTIYVASVFLSLAEGETWEDATS